jgi:D-alanyl-D-alanine carboxypeptidase/D-alanyl-D-alanine-endopeptidase (penicillin-binding protein 4)
MLRISFLLASFPQKGSVESLLSDSIMVHASVSLCVTDARNGEIVLEHNSGKSLTPASVMKLITSAAALELMGPHHTFRTIIGYTGSINKRSGKLKGDIVIKGGGDPALGSPYFAGHYRDFPERWIREIKNLGIKKVEGRIISDDSYFDYLPVPAKWLWEDAGNYYGAGAYGLSVFDNTYEIHLKTSSDSSSVAIISVVPDECRAALSNWLFAAGTTDEGYVFAAPYSTNGWLAGSIPAGMNDFVLKASITDPPLLMAKIIDKKLEEDGIIITGDPTTYRLDKKNLTVDMVTIAETISPELSEIITVLNHESVNLYAEHIIKELGRNFREEGSTASGVDVIFDFLHNANIKTEGMFIEDGSGLSPLDALSSRGLVDLLYYMKSRGQYFSDYYSSLPDAGKDGTLKYCFKDPVFESRLKAKSGSMTRVRCYAGYFTTIAGNEMIFCILVNNYSGPSQPVIDGIENIIREIILYK